MGDTSQGIRIRSSMRNLNNYLAFVSQIERKTIEEAKNNPNWIITMEEELNQFKRYNVWT